MILNTTTIVIAIITMLLGAVSYFLGQIYVEFKEYKKESFNFRYKTAEDIGKLKGEIRLAQQEQRLKHDQIEINTQLKIESLTTEVTRLAITVEKLIKYKEQG